MSSTQTAAANPVTTKEIHRILTTEERLVRHAATLNLTIRASALAHSSALAVLLDAIEETMEDDCCDGFRAATSAQLLGFRIRAHMIEVEGEQTDTVAEAISRRFEGDGQRFEDAGENDLLDVLFEHCTARSGPSSWRHEMIDGSAIVRGDGWWDLGIKDRDCCCGASEGHDLGCEYRFDDKEEEAKGILETGMERILVLGPVNGSGSWHHAVCQHKDSEWYYDSSDFGSWQELINAIIEESGQDLYHDHGVSWKELDRVEPTGIELPEAY